jgi:acyl-CoA thioesterase FadM
MFGVKRDIHIEWGHCDPARIVFNPNFFVWMESGMDRLFSVAYRPIAVVVAALALFSELQHSPLNLGAQQAQWPGVFLSKFQ